MTTAFLRGTRDIRHPDGVAMNSSPHDEAQQSMPTASAVVGVVPARGPYDPPQEFRAHDIRPGTVIAGRYKLLQQIGEGGFGVVFLAEQEHPVRRKVALKLIKLGMDTKQVVARFEG